MNKGMRRREKVLPVGIERQQAGVERGNIQDGL